MGASAMGVSRPFKQGSVQEVLLSSMASCVPAILSLQRSGSCGAHKRADRAERHAAHL